MTEQEQKDLEILKAEQLKIKCQLYDMLRITDRASREELDAMGQRNKTASEAMQSQFRYYHKKLEELVKAFIRKYPDE